ncbi:Crp/Fnr family transcriptional regulator [Nitrosospira sp. NpAV]|uniref:Crp/Fnr family transcriptional regulator n=1 Tax=Nitrosospira sp. NpAV TaxID=58133 RepID=UPI000695FA60|nr:Crp/Fnr family transcriptional regulator [Nitrosospira sp. NpAV]
MPLIQGPKQNRILAELPSASYTRLLPFLELVRLPAGYIIHEPGFPIRQLYFPTTCLVARRYEMENGLSTQIGTTGNQGLTGISFLLGAETNPVREVVQSTGSAYRINASFLKKEFESSGDFQNLLLRFAQALIFADQGF